MKAPVHGVTSKGIKYEIVFDCIDPEARRKQCEAAYAILKRRAEIDAAKRKAATVLEPPSGE